MGVDWTLIVGNTVQVGDIVSADAGGMPLYRVVSIDECQALVRDEEHQTEARLPLARFRWKAASLPS